MSEQTDIEWCDSTFNGWRICTPTGRGCDNCYAAALSARFGWGEYKSGVPRQRTSDAYWRQPLRWNARASEFGQCDVCGWRGERGVHVKPDGTRIRWAVCPACSNGLMKPARRRVFSASLSDWLDNEAPIEWLVDLLDLIRRTPNLDWLMLSKRIGNWRSRMNAAIAHIEALPDWPNEHSRRGHHLEPLRNWLADWLVLGKAPANVWLGATVVNQTEVDRDVSKLVATPARIRFLSIEPMLGPVDVSKWLPHLNQVICGGESGPRARPLHPQWQRMLRDQCAAAGVPFLLKQHGEWADFTMAEVKPDKESVILLPSGEIVGAGYKRSGTVDGDWLERGGAWMCKVGKKAAGRLLDGVLHHAFPEVIGV